MYNEPLTPAERSFVLTWMTDPSGLSPRVNVGRMRLWHDSRILEFDERLSVEHREDGSVECFTNPANLAMLLFMCELGQDTDTRPEVRIEPKYPHPSSGEGKHAVLYLNGMPHRQREWRLMLTPLMVLAIRAGLRITSTTVVSE